MRANLPIAVALAASLAAAGAAWAESWTNAPLVDVNCSTRVKDAPDAHTRACALKCADSGYGIWTAEGKYLKFDAEGSKQAKALLEASDRKDHLRVDVSGELVDGALKVTSIAMSPAG
ncbi:MAG: hypothetical protein NDJ75_10355 [Thermoanaerobaculia bacterium]|nr:hypothetical protein [Thermoanaerobaculia bacterium]